MTLSKPNLTLVRPAKLVLTKAEILAAIAPIQKLAARIKDTNARFDAWNEMPPTNDDDETIGFVDDEERIEVEADLDLYDTVDGLSANEYRPPHYREGEFTTLWRVIYDAIRAEVFKRDEEQAAAARKKRAEKGAVTRAEKARERREAERERENYIAELEAKLAAKEKPRLTLVGREDT